LRFGIGWILMRTLFWALTFACFTAIASNASGQDWAKEMFSDTSHDFGVVARGAKVEYKIPIENKYEEDVHITSVRSSCGCTTPKVDKKLIKTWEKAELSLIVDTRTFLGRREATITITFDQPFPAEVQVHVYAYIRSDVVVQPGVVQFGTVSQGIAMKQRVTVTYAGRSDWKIDRVESACPYLEGQVKEVSRADGQVKYELWTILKADAPVGYIQDQIFLITDDPDQRSSRVPVPVEGIIASTSALSIRPSPLFLGIVDAGQSITKPLVIQGKTPFNIISVTSSDPHFKFKKPDGSKTAQLLPITFTADEATGKFTGKIHIETDFPNSKPLDVDVNVQVK
jgi:hypothetical protein